MWNGSGTLPCLPWQQPAMKGALSRRGHQCQDCNAAFPPFPRSACSLPGIEPPFQQPRLFLLLLNHLLMGPEHHRGHSRSLLQESKMGVLDGPARRGELCMRDYKPLPYYVTEKRYRGAQLATAPPKTHVGKI